MNTLLEYGIVAVFVALLLAPLGLPVPEDISLLVAGYLAAEGHTNIVTAWVVGYVGILCGDSIAWTMGRRLGLSAGGFLGRVMGARQTARIARFYRRWGRWAIVIARQVPGMRLPTFFFAGATGVPLPRFLLADGAAATITATLYVGAGYLFADRFEELVGRFEGVRNVLLVAAGIALLLVAFWIIRERLLSDRERQLP